MKGITNFQQLLLLALVLSCGLNSIACKNEAAADKLVQPDFIVHGSGFSEGDTIFFENTTSGLTDDRIQWRWNFDNGKTSGERDPYTLYDTAGTYSVTLSARHAGEKETLKTATLVIKEAADTLPQDPVKPVIAFTYELPPDYYDTAVYAGTTLKFIDRTHGTIVQQQWTFNDAETRSGKMAEYTFENAGNYTVALSVTDDKGIAADTTFQISVRGVEFAQWKPGYLDIHHINTGRGDASFFIFPDGTNMLFDAGDKDVPGSGSTPDFPVHPHPGKTPGEWIADYVTRFIPDGFPVKIDYAVLSHFHVDHMGRINSRSPRSSYGDYRLGGITQVAELIPVSKLIDKAYPTYDFPVDLKNDRDDIENYIDFLNYHTTHRGLQAERIAVGSSDQIVPGHNPSYDFRVTNLYASGEFRTGEGGKAPHAFSKPLVNDKGEWNDNPLSIALKIEYGLFDYYTGGDITGNEDWPDYDIETPLGNLVGEVDAMAVNHHGYKDATNQNFVNALTPQVAVQQTSNVSHVNVGVVNRLRSVNADLFISNIGQIYAASAIAGYYKSLEGHVVIRVYEGGETFEVFILSDRVATVPGIKKFGPYRCR